MPAVSKAQSRLLNARFGHRWVQEHHFDNVTSGLPLHVKHDPKPAYDGHHSRAQKREGGRFSR